MRFLNIFVVSGESSTVKLAVAQRSVRGLARVCCLGLFGYVLSELLHSSLCSPASAAKKCWPWAEASMDW